MEKQRDQKIFHRYNRTVEVCGKCGGEGKILVWPEGDFFKQQEPSEEVCSLCLGSGLVRKTVTIITDLAPFRRE